MSDDRDEWGRPVKANSGRFPEGVSGNPRGRPPKRERALTLQQSELDFLEVLDEEHSVIIQGKPRKLTTLQLFIRQLAQKALKGDDKLALDLMKIGNSILGKSTRPLADEAAHLKFLERHFEEMGGEKNLPPDGVRALNQARKNTRPNKSGR